MCVCVFFLVRSLLVFVDALRYDDDDMNEVCKSEKANSERRERERSKGILRVCIKYHFGFLLIWCVDDDHHCRRRHHSLVTFIELPFSVGFFFSLLQQAKWATQTLKNIVMTGADFYRARRIFAHNKGVFVDRKTINISSYLM